MYNFYFGNSGKCTWDTIRRGMATKRKTTGAQDLVKLIEMILLFPTLM